MQQQPTSNNNPLPNPTNPALLQESSLFTQRPQSEGSGMPLILPPPEQKTLFPVKTGIAQLDSQGRLDFSVPASALQLGRVLGKGGFGAVYEAIYAGKLVAVKRINIQLSVDALQELKREAEIMLHLGLTSEHIVKLIKICLEPPSLVMELMPKGSLYDLLHNGQDLPWPIRYQIALDAVSGLRDLHEHQPVILHRDLKSFNILLNDRLRAKLGDFGLAKVKHESSSQSSVSKGKVGTLLWMAPELFDDEPKVTAASDIYSFGMVLWELVTRRLPYDKWRPEAAGVRIAQGKKEEIPSDCPPALKKIIESCWQSTPAERPTAIRVQENLKPLTEQKVSSPNDSDSEIKKLKAEMEQMKLAHERQLAEEKQKATQLQLVQEQQLRAAAEEKRRLEAEKQAEIDRLKQQNQQHQLELKRTKNLKYESPLQPPKSTPPLPSISQTIPQTLIPPPKPQATSAQLALQKQLIAACEKGDAKAMEALFKQGAKPDMANAQGKHPLGAAIWSMCPDVVNVLLKQAGDVAPMTWDECEKHNLKYYKEVFIVPKFDPQTYGEWHRLLQKMDPYPFIRAYHLNKADERWSVNEITRWEDLKEYVRKWSGTRLLTESGVFDVVAAATEREYIAFRTQIKQFIESAKQPTAEINTLQHQADLKSTQKNLKYESPAQTPKSTLPLPPVWQKMVQTLMPGPKPKSNPMQLALQDQLIAACKQGDEKIVKALLQQGAKPDMVNAKDEQPLGAAVWGMCPDIVNVLLKQVGGATPMTWDECEKHNLKHYKEVFIVPKFDPKTFEEWNALIQKIDPNPFIRAFHLKKVDEEWHNLDSASWENLKKYIGVWGRRVMGSLAVLFETTEQGYLGFRTQIKQTIQSAIQPTVQLNF